MVIHRGRPLGARNAATRLAEQLLDGEAAAITRKAIALAKSEQPASVAFVHGPYCATAA